MDRLNLFNPFESRPDQHEDRLTWAFLVSLKYDPVLQKFLRERVESSIPVEPREYSAVWESAHVSTQTQWIEDTNRIVSVLLTDTAIHEKIKVEWSDRRAIYDGIIRYPDGLTLIVENKLSHEQIWKEQLSPSRDSFRGQIAETTLHNSAICLEWSEILEGVLEYSDSDLASFGSREIARDFLSFVEAKHPGLTPYRTFRLCGDRFEALERRTDSLLVNLASVTNLEKQRSGDYGYLDRPGKIAERVYIWIPRSMPRKLRVNLYPADTVAQARNFFRNVDKEAFLSLNESDAWRVEPNLHFSFISRHLIWAKTELHTRDYLNFFSNSSTYGQKKKDELLRLSKQWAHEGVISSEDCDKIKDQFSKTERSTLNVVPGFSVYREWDLDTVIELEDQEKLESSITEALLLPLKTWAEKKL